MMNNKELIDLLNKQLPDSLPQHISKNEILKKLSGWINYLIQTDFQKLLLILYKTDVNEIKLKRLLQANANEDAALIIAKLILEREQQKIISRNKPGSKNEIFDEERW